MKKRKMLLFFLAAGLIIAGIYSSKDSFLLKTPKAQNGMLSLGLTFSNVKEDTILQEWRKSTAYERVYSGNPDSIYTARPINGLSTAAGQRTADFGFIFFYLCLFNLLLFINRNQFKLFPTKVIMFRVLMVAALCDILQNIFMLVDMKLAQANHPYAVMAPYIGTAFSIKWLLWIFFAVVFYIRVIHPRQNEFLKKFNEFTKSLIIQLWHFRITLIGLAVLYIALTLVDQGEDLVVGIGDSLPGTGFFVFVIFILAMLNWYLPKVFDNADSLHTPPKKFRNDKLNIKQYLGRIMGSVTLLVPATGILSAMQDYHVDYWLSPVPTPIVFILVVWLYIYLLQHRILEKIYLDKNRLILKRFLLSVTIILFCVAGLAFCIAGKQWPLGALSLIFFLLSFLFLITVSCRTYFKYNFPFLPVLYTAASLVFIVFVLFNFRFFSAKLTQYTRFSTLPVFIAGMIFYTLLSTGLLLLGRRYNFRFITVLIAIMVFFSSYSITQFHMVSTVPRRKKLEMNEISLRGYIHRWLHSRQKEILLQSQKGREFPVFFVNAYGGGIRAAAWTVMSVGYLNKQLLDTAKASYQPDFEHYVFSYSGASGGTIGESMLVGAEFTNPGDPLRDAGYDTATRIMKIFRHDYLTNNLIGIIGRDFWMGSSGLDCCDDRAKVTEKAYEDYLRTLMITYDKPFRLGWQDTAMKIPLFVSNTCDVNTSRKGILSPVTLSPADFPGVIQVQSLIKQNDIHLSSGAFLSARFPYVSPMGKFNEDHHFTDGGTVENAGSETSLQLIRVFNNILDSLKRKHPEYRCLKICILSLPNSEASLTKVERVKNMYEMTGPIKGLLGTITGNAAKDDSINHDSARIYGWHYYQMVPWAPKIENGKIDPILPLGWQISDYALEKMETTVARPNSELGHVVAMFKTDFRK